MEIVKVTKREDIKDGDSLLVEWKDRQIIFYTNTFSKITANDGHEVICRRKDNHFFNLDMYLNDASVAKEVYVIRGEHDNN